MPTGIGDDYFDGTDSVVRIRRHMNIARDLGVHYLRCAFSWNGIEQKQGKYSWRFWDQLVSESERAGIRLIPYVAYTPEWAAQSRMEYWRQPPRSPALFAAFMQAIVSRYRGRIGSWELWNEPDLPEYWNGTPEEFAKLIRWGAIAARRADPNVVIVLGGLSLGPSPFFRTLMDHEHIASYVDVIAQHAYPESWDPERAETVYVGWTKTMDDSIRQSASGVDFWLNEIGYPDYRFSATNVSKYGNTDAYYDYEHTRRYQAVFLFKSFVLARSSPASLAVWYRIDDFPKEERRLGDDLIHVHLGVVDASGKPKPDYRAFQFFNRLFSSPVRSVFASDQPINGNAVIKAFKRQDGEVIVAAWLRSSERGEVLSMTGVETDRRSESVSIPLPCREVQDVRYLDVFGKAVPSVAAVEHSTVDTRLGNVVLRGDDVFIAVADCKN